MVKRCFVIFCKTGCKSYRNNELKFSLFKAPNDEILLEKWREKIPLRERELNNQDRICEKHFEKRFVAPRWKQSRFGDDCYEDHIRPKLTPDAIPTIFPDADPTGKPLAFKAQKGSGGYSVMIKNIALELPGVVVNENDYVPVCYKCLIKKCSSHIVYYNEEKMSY